MEITTIDEVRTEDSVLSEGVSTETSKTSTPAPFSTGLLVGLIATILCFTTALGYVAGKYVKMKTVVTPTPTPAVTAIVTPTMTITPTTTETVTPSVTPTATVKPTIATVTKTAKIKEFGGDYTLKFTLNLPNDVTISETKVGSWNGILLRKGAKAIMAFNLPYELYENQGYSTLLNVSSTSIAGLKRVRAKKVFQASGSYSFAVAYVTSGSLSSGKDCTEPVVANATTSPCAMPSVLYSTDIAFGAYCSVDPANLAICDQIMKTIKVVKE